MPSIAGLPHRKTCVCVGSNSYPSSRSSRPDATMSCTCCFPVYPGNVGSRLWGSRVVSAVILCLCAVSQGCETREAVQPEKAAEARQAQQPLATGEEAQTPEKTEEPERAPPGITRQTAEFPGERRFVLLAHVTLRVCVRFVGSFS